MRGRKPTRPLTTDEIRRELDDIYASFTKPLRARIRKAMKDLRPSQSELYARKLRP